MKGNKTRAALEACTVLRPSRQCYKRVTINLDYDLCCADKPRSVVVVVQVLSACLPVCLSLSLSLTNTQTHTHTYTHTHTIWMEGQTVEQHILKQVTQILLQRSTRSQGIFY